MLLKETHNNLEHAYNTIKHFDLSTLRPFDLSTFRPFDLLTF